MNYNRPHHTTTGTETYHCEQNLQWQEPQQAVADGSPMVSRTRPSERHCLFLLQKAFAWTHLQNTRKATEATLRRHWIYNLSAKEGFFLTPILSWMFTLFYKCHLYQSPVLTGHSSELTHMHGTNNNVT